MAPWWPLLSYPSFLSPLWIFFPHFSFCFHLPLSNILSSSLYSSRLLAISVFLPLCRCASIFNFDLRASGVLVKGGRPSGDRCAGPTPEPFSIWVNSFGLHFTKWKNHNYTFWTLKRLPRWYSGQCSRMKDKMDVDVNKRFISVLLS